MIILTRLLVSGQSAEYSDCFLIGLKYSADLSYPNKKNEVWNYPRFFQIELRLDKIWREKMLRI